MQCNIANYQPNEDGFTLDVTEVIYLHHTWNL